MVGKGGGYLGVMTHPGHMPVPNFTGRDLFLLAVSAWHCPSTYLAHGGAVLWAKKVNEEDGDHHTLQGQSDLCGWAASNPNSPMCLWPGSGVGGSCRGFLVAPSTRLERACWDAMGEEIWKEPEPPRVMNLG